MQAKLMFDQESLFNHYVASHPQGEVLQTTHWGKVKQESGWSYYPLAAWSGGVIRGTVLLLAKKLAPLPGTLFYSPRGPLFSSEQALEALGQAGSDLAREKGALVWKMDPALPAHDPLWLEFSSRRKLRRVESSDPFAGVQPRFVMVLDIRANPAQLLSEMKSKTRYNIRYSERKDVRVFPARDREDLTVFYTLLQETALRDGFSIRPRAYFDSLWKHLVQNKLAQLFLAWHDNTPLAGAILFRLEKKAWYVYGASSSQNRNLQASHLIQWEMIRWSKGLGCQSYDFRGVSGDLDPAGPLYGLYRFKEGFGAQLQEFVGEYDWPISRGGYALWRRSLAIHNLLRQAKRPSARPTRPGSK